MGIVIVLLSSLAGFAAATATALGGSGFWMTVLTFYGAGFGALALLLAWQCVPQARTLWAPATLPAAEPQHLRG